MSQPEAKLRTLIKQHNNFLSFDQFQEFCLYDPEYGYYTLAKNSFDKHGDFITAPHYSKLFGYTIANFIVNNKNNVDILELGAGTGELAQQVLEFFKTNNITINNYYILDLSPNYRKIQANNLNKYNNFTNIIWLNNYTDLKNLNFNGAVIANEVLDALPTKRLYLNSNKTFEIGISLDQNDNLIWNKLINNNLNLNINLDYNNYYTEVNLNYNKFITNLLKYTNIKKSNNLYLFFDYGYLESEYYHPDRINGTLRAYHKHQIISEHNIINSEYLNNIDISSHVNFSEIIKSLKSNNLNYKYTTQAEFLLENKILDLAQQYINFNNPSSTDLAKISGLKALIMPEILGSCIKVLAFASNLLA